MTQQDHLSHDIWPLPYRCTSGVGATSHLLGSERSSLTRMHRPMSVAMLTTHTQAHLVTHDD